MRDKFFDKNSGISDFSFVENIVAALENLVANFSASTLPPFCL